MSALKASNLPVDKDDASTDLCFQRGAVVGSLGESFCCSHLRRSCGALRTVLVRSLGCGTAPLDRLDPFARRKVGFLSAVVGRALITRSFAECAFDARIWHYDPGGLWPRWISRLKSPPGLNVPGDFGSFMGCYSFSK